MTFELRPYADDDLEPVLALWEACGLTRPWNDPRKDIGRKLTVQPELFIVGTLQERVVATAMGGYDGHRGWVNYLAVEPACQRQGLGEAIMRRLETLLIERGCPKLNLQVRGSNQAALAFYARLGYRQDDVVSLGHRLIAD
ncbi:GNAT family acetyltransferase [Rhizobacter sp. LjRoot28]|uniref:GNAT family acetyltransferase n=1 Tax=Rhizobacter sp. LjRoot28 TaxID=3342309 RepID=UPI003ED012BD